MANIKNRKKVEELVISTINKLEPSGMNAEKYKALFKKMNDKEFLDYFKRMASSDDFNFYIENDLYGKNQITLKSVKAALDHLNCPLEEYVYLRHKTDDGRPIRSKQRVPVLYVHLKRMQQLLSKKNIVNPDIDRAGTRNKITGGLNTDNKSGRFTDADLQALVSVTSSTMEGEDNPIVREFLGSRSDNMYDKRILYQNISITGDASLAGIDEVKRTENVKSSGRAVKTMDEFLLGAGIVSDLSV